MKVISSDLARIYAASVGIGGLQPHDRASRAVMDFLGLIEDITGKPPDFTDRTRPEDKIIG